MLLHPIPLQTTFDIAILYNRKRYTYKVAKTKEEGLMEYWTVYGRHQQLIFSSNRMVWRNRGVKHNDYTMRLIQGQLMYKSLEEDVVDAIKRKVEKLEDAIRGGEGIT